MQTMSTRSSPDMVVASTDLMNSISEEDKPVFEEAFKMMSQKEREFWDESEAEVIKEAEDMGVTFEHVDKAPFQAILVPFTEEIIAEDEGLAAKYEQIKALAQ